MPKAWNRELVLYLRPFNPAGQPVASLPPNREYLVAHGYAWATSSLSSAGFLPGLAADESLALRTEFIRMFGMPRRTYVIGSSMGGGGAAIAAERYGGEIDGALAMCAVAGNRAHFGYATDLLLLGANVAGVTQSEIDELSAENLIKRRIVTRLVGSSSRDLFEERVIESTGGLRPLAMEGLREAEASNWNFVEAMQAARLLDTADASVAEPRLTIHAGDRRKSMDGQNFNGDLQVPLLTLHDTGDAVVPISEARAIRKSVDVAAKGDLLVQRTVQSATHCDFTPREMTDAFEALVGWVEDGRKPSGEDLLASDLSSLGSSFTDFEDRQDQ